MNTKLIKLFNCALKESDSLNFASVNSVANKLGYLVHPDACTSSVLQFLEEQSINYNSTFYQTWEDVTSKDRLTLLFDQILHYVTTYGTEFSLGNGYVPNESEEAPVVNFNVYKVIMPISEAELYKRCFNMLASGIALKQDTMEACADYVIDMCQKSNDFTCDADAIKNREALVYICKALNILPQEKFNLFRYIIYVTTGSSMIIKNDEMISAITNSKTQFDFSTLSEKNMEALASIFLRYKDLFLAFKHTTILEDFYENTRWGKCVRRNVKQHTSANAPYINKLRKMAVKLHMPMQQGFWQTVFTEEKTIDALTAEVEKLSNYKKVALMQNCIERAMGSENQFYLIRNQKTFLREGYKSKTDVKYAMLVYTILRTSLLKTLRANSTKTVVKIDESTGKSYTEYVPKTVRVANNVTIALPSSEKSFIGNYPFGTSYKLSTNNYFGIYWREEWGTRDYDLSFIDCLGRKIGWNGGYYSDNKDVIYSGDMTNADPEAAEIIYMKKAGVKGIIKINQFAGNANSKYRFFFGQDDISELSMNYMVNPNSIALEFEVPVNNQREQQIGVVDEDRVVLMSVNTGNSHVSSLTAKQAEMLQDAIMRKAHSFINAEEILREAGFNIVDEIYQNTVDIDFKNLDKDSLIAIMSEPAK